MLFVIGLGNLGEKYQYTRHNVAWMIIDTLESQGWEYHKYMHADVCDTGMLLYIKPRTFMNHSGDVLNYLKQHTDFSLDKLVVIHDDVDLPFGDIRVSYNRGDGGHKGLKSINQNIQSHSYLRIRIGVSFKNTETGELVKPNVLGNFGEQERTTIIHDISPRVADILAMLPTKGKEAVMNYYN